MCRSASSGKTIKGTTESRKRLNKQSQGGKPREEKKEQPTQLIEKIFDDVYVATMYHFHGVNKLKPYVSQKV